MPTPFFADLVRELCQEGGTGPLMPTGAVPGHRRFSGTVPVGDPFHYAIAGIAQPAQWEVGSGRIDGAGRLQRDSVAASSNAGGLVDFARGLKTIALTVGADWFAAHDAAGGELAEALAAKQPLSTTHAAATTGAADDRVTVRRGEGWVNLPLSALAFRGGDGRYAPDGSIGVQNGSAAAPAIGFAADPDTGLFRAAADAIGMATDGAERLRLSPSGQLGVGTSAPAARLHVEAGSVGDVARFGAPGGQALYLYADTAFAGLFNVAGAGASRDGVRIGSDFVALDTGAAERLRIDGTGNVGIGTIAPGNSGGFNRQLQIQGDYPCVTLSGNAAARSYSIGVNSAGGFAIWDNVANASRLLLAANGNLGVGALTGAPSVRLHAVSSGEILRLETTQARGAGGCAQYWYDGTGAKGYFGFASLFNDQLYLMNSMSAAMILGTNNVDRWQVAAAGHFQPMADNALDAGHASARIRTIYLVNSPSVTSDEREKEWRGAPDAAEMRAAKRIVAELGFYRWNDAIAAEGAANAPCHFGVRAQRVWAIMADEGLVAAFDAGGSPGATPYAFLCHDIWEEAGEARDRFSVRPDQLCLFLIAAQEARLAALEAAA